MQLAQTVRLESYEDARPDWFVEGLRQRLDERREKVIQRAAISILAVDCENVALLHQPERGNGVYVLNQYARPLDAAVTDDLLLVLHRHGTPQRQWRFYDNRDADALQRARRQLQTPCHAPTNACLSTH